MASSSSTDHSQVSRMSSSPTESGSRNYRRRSLEVYRSLLRDREDVVLSRVNLMEELNRHFEQFTHSYSVFTGPDDVLLHIRMLEAANYFVNGVAMSIRAVDVEQESANLKKEAENCEKARKAEAANPKKEAENCEKARKASFEILFSAIHRAQLLEQLSGTLHDIRYDVREAHMFRTLDDISLYVFNVRCKNQDIRLIAERIAKSLISSKHCTGVKFVAAAPPDLNEPPVFCHVCESFKFSSRCRCSGPLPALTSVFCRFCYTFNSGAGCSCNHPPPPRPIMIPRALRLQGYQEKSRN